MTNKTHGAKPGQVTSNKKVAGGFRTTTATTSNATKIIAVYACVKGAIGRFIPRFEWVITADAVMMTAIMALIVWGGAMNQNATNDLDFATCQRPSKSIATQIAELALASHTVHQLQCGGYLVSKWGYSHYAKDFEALQVFARRLGVSK